MSVEAKTVTIKQRVEHILRQLPDDCTLDDIYYHLDVLERLIERIEIADKGVFLSQDEFDRRMEKWLKK